MKNFILLAFVSLLVGVQPSVLSHEKIFAIVVPHHDLVAKERAAFFDDIAKRIDQPSLVFLVGPNHDETGVDNIQYNDSDHAIYLVAPDITRVFPKARIVPIILKMGTPSTQIQALSQTILDQCHAVKDRCLLVASVDFSHYLPAVLANLHDELAIRALDDLDIPLVRSRAEVDSPATLELMMRFAAAHKTERFVLQNHTNSGEILNDPDLPSTTHVFGYYTSGPRTISPPAVSFVIGGDVMLARGVAHRYFFQQGDFAKVVRTSLGDRVFWGTDAGIINLEGAISATAVADHPQETFSFVFPPQSMEVLKYLRITAASLDNNHAHNGNIKITKTLLAQNNIQFLPATIQGEKLKLTVLGINTVGIPVVNIKDKISKIKTDPDARVIIFPHWGTEYATLHNKEQEALAHSWIDAGADAVIGSHPHVVQDMETYKGKPIIYSLGNLVFDQTWSAATQKGMLIAGSFTADGLTLIRVPIQSTQYQPFIAKGTTLLNL